MRLNPNAVVFWAIGGMIGWLAGDTTGAVIGVIITMTFSLFKR